MEWTWKHYSELTTDELYAILRLRQEVFAIEQNIVYQDCDNRDQDAYHLMGFHDGALAAYLRVLKPGVKYDEVAFGRVLSSEKVRGTGAGKALTAEALRCIDEVFGPSAVRISAQSYLKRFYSGFGFETVGEDYIEEDVLHCEMLRPAP